MISASNELFFAICAKFEREGNFCDAFFTMATALNCKKNFSLQKMYELNTQRIIKKVQKKAISLWKHIDPKPIYIHKKNPNTYIDDCKSMQINLPPLIALTSISSRIDKLEITIDSIVNQSADVHSINLYISSEPYLIDNGIDLNSKYLFNIYKKGVNIYLTPNIGPYRKQIPIIKQLRVCGAYADTPIITLDDDVLYPTNIVELLMSKLNFDESVVAHRGRELVLQDENIMSYQSTTVPQHQLSMLNLGTGKNGIAYKLKFFSKNDFDYIGHILAPTCDDIWCKWVVAKYCIPTFILEPQAAFDKNFDFDQSLPEDKSALYHKYNAAGGNDKAIANMELYFSYTGISLKSIFQGSYND